MAKGSQFERDICRQLSEWWSKGLEGKERDDIFWRSTQSGGRATQRAKSGLKTFGSYGDVAAVDPIGQPLLQFVTIELKRGRSHGCPNDLFDCRPSTKPKPFEQALVQARTSAEAADSVGWLLISRRDGRQSMAYLDWAAYLKYPFSLAGNVVRVSLELCDGTAVRFAGLKLEQLLKRVQPIEIKQLVSHAKRDLPRFDSKVRAK